MTAVTDRRCECGHIENHHGSIDNTCGETPCTCQRFTTNAPSGLPLSGSLLADGGAEGGDESPLRPETNWAYGFGYGRQALVHAIRRLESHQYKNALADLRSDLAFLDRMATGWNPEAER